MTDELAQTEAPASIEDRMEAFGHRLAGEDAPAEVAPEAGPELAEIEFEGEKFQVPPKLKDAFLRNSDYTQKTQSLASEREKVSHTLSLLEQSQLERAFSQSVTGENQELAVIEAYLAQSQKMDWANMNTEQILRQRIELDSVKERRAALKDSIAEKRGKFEADVKSKIAELKTKAREIASKSITGFSEDTEKAVRSYGVAEGLTERQVDNVLLDPSSFRILWKASQYEKLSANAGKAAAAAERVVKPQGSRPMPQDVRAKLDLNKALRGAKTSGEKAKVIESRIESMFARG